MRKNFLLIFSIVILAVFVTGCGKKSTLKCTQSSNGVDIIFNVGFDGNTISTMDFSYDMDLSSYPEESLSYVDKQDWCSLVKDSMSEYKSAFTNCKHERNDRNLHVSATLDVDKIAKNVLSKMSTPEATKKGLEEQGYKCNID